MTLPELKFGGKRVLVVGDVMLDAYIYGDVERISPEAPVPVLHQKRIDYKPGGAANVAVGTARLGATTHLFGITGNDDYHNILLGLCSASSIQSHFLKLRSKTTIKQRIISRGQHLLRIDIEENSPLSLSQEVLLVDELKRLLKNEKWDAIIIQDYDKGVMSKKVLEAILEFSSSSTVITVDPKKRMFQEYRDITLLKPNLREFLEGVNIRDENLDHLTLIKIAGDYIKEKNIKNIMITMGAEGILYHNESETGLSPAFKKEIVDVTGAGDTVISVATLCLTLGFSLKEISRICNAAACVVCSKVGVYAPVPEEIEKILASQV